MLVSVLILLAGQAKPAPVVPPGCSAYFSQTVAQIVEKLEAGDFAAADRLTPLLPTSKVAVWWDDTSIPEKLRPEFSEARNRAFGQVTSFLKTVSFDVGAGKPHIKISFAETLPPASEGAVPPGAVFMISDSVNEPRVEAVIALKRGSPAQPAQAHDIQSEITFALGTYFGLAQSKMPGMSYRIDTSWNAPNRVSTRDMKMIQTTVKIADDLRQAVAKKEKLEGGRPELQLNPLKMELGTSAQGELVPFSMQASNQGTSLLQLYVQPDCSCFVTTQFLQIGPGETALIKGSMDTTEFAGDLTKTLMIVSNDVDFPIREVPVTIKIEPRYRLLMPSGPVLLMQDGGGAVDVYLVTAEGKGFDLTEVRVDGLPGEVKYQKWSGMLADPEMNEPARQRQGYKFTVKLKDALPGRSHATLMIGTKDEKFPVLRQNIAAQKGIVALPEQLWLGEIGRTPKRVVFLLSRPQVDFKIKKIESDSKAITATHQPVRGQWEHKVIVEYSGDADFGNMASMLTIHTDDPKQPKILVPVTAVVR